MDGTNTDLAKTAIIGNVGDMMARETCGLVGLARDVIVEDGVLHRNVEVHRRDLNCYGTATRPVYLSLAYNDDPFIGGISNNPDGAKQFLRQLGIQHAPPGSIRRVSRACAASRRRRSKVPPRSGKALKYRQR